MRSFRGNLLFFQRLIAVCGITLVLLLTLLAAYPSLHASLHGQGNAPAAAGARGPEQLPVGDADHVCAITLFALGVEPLLFFCLLVWALLPALPVVWWKSTWLAPIRPRYWLRPSHAPPLS